MRFKYAFLGVLLTSSVCVQYGCTIADDSADDTTPSAGKGNASSGGKSGGSSHAGASNEGGAAGSTNDDAGAGGVGDEPGTGGSSGSSVVSGGKGGSAASHGGSAGSSGAGTSHGGSAGSGTGGANNGGTTSGGTTNGGTTSGGGATQSSACQTCATTNCNSATTDGCGHLTGADVTKCQSVLDCIVSKQCATNTDGDATSACYCGSESKDSCFFEPSASTLMGACTQVIETASGNVLPLQIATIYYDNSTPVGAATQHIECEQQKCKTECF